MSYVDFRISKKHLYYNFINLFEILLNEVRKRELALGLFQYSELTIEEMKKTYDPIQLKYT